MNKYFLILLLTFIFIIPVHAETEEVSITTIDLMQTEFTPYSNISSHEGCVSCGIYLGDKYIYNYFDKFYSDIHNKNIFDTLWQEISSFSSSNNFFVSVLILSNSSTELDLFSVLITVYGKNYMNAIMYVDGTFYGPVSSSGSVHPSYSINGSTFYPFLAMPHYSSANPFVVGTGEFSSSWFFLPTISFTNTLKYHNEAENTIFNIYDTNSNLLNTVSYGSQLPQLYEWGTFDPTANYIDVNLDNYEYVILSLKDYSQTEPFSTYLKVKGMIGITPVYEFGTAEKTEITDRCNLSYTDYTDYRFYILKSDLQNNSVFYVKSCQDNSSFKFDSSLFNITYVTSENKDDPIITIDGQDYHTIPFDKLSNSANKNEEENYVPGESGSSLSSIVENLSNTLDGIWSSFTTFMGFVTKMFNTLPIEFRTIAITTFTVSCVLGLIKILKG